MGWSSWNAFGETITQEKIENTARAMVQSGLNQHGFTYINMDDGWQGKRDGKYKGLQGNEKFPDMGALVDTIHKLGLKAGIYSTPWETSPGADFTGAVKTDHWYVIDGIEVEAPKPAAAVAVFGDSITDGRGSGTNMQDRWPDILEIALQKKSGTRQVAVLNMGIGGNAVLKVGLGPTGLNRFDHDVLKQNGVKWLIIFEGVNDLGGTRDSTAAFDVAKGLTAAYDKMIKEAHANGIKVYGATITPFKKSFYYRTYRDAARDMVNEWICTSGHFDAVIDFDKLIRDPGDAATLIAEAQSGDYLHPNELGYKMFGESVDLSLFQ